MRESLPWETFRLETANVTWCLCKTKSTRQKRLEACIAHRYIKIFITEHEANFMSWRVYLANRLETAIQLVMWMVALHLPWFNQPNHALFWKRCGFNQSRSQTAFCSLGTRLSRGHGDKITQNIIHHQATHNNRDTKISKSDSVDYFSSSSAASAARRPGAPITPPPEWIVEYITFCTLPFFEHPVSTVYYITLGDSALSVEASTGLLV